MLLLNSLVPYGINLTISTLFYIFQKFISCTYSFKRIHFILCLTPLLALFIRAFIAISFISLSSFMFPLYVYFYFSVGIYLYESVPPPKTFTSNRLFRFRRLFRKISQRSVPKYRIKQYRKHEDSHVDVEYECLKFFDTLEPQVKEQLTGLATSIGVTIEQVATVLHTIKIGNLSRHLMDFFSDNSWTHRVAILLMLVELYMPKPLHEMEGFLLAIDPSTQSSISGGIGLIGAFIGKIFNKPELISKAEETIAKADSTPLNLCHPSFQEQDDDEPEFSVSVSKGIHFPLSECHVPLPSEYDPPTSSATWYPPPPADFAEPSTSTWYRPEDDYTPLPVLPGERSTKIRQFCSVHKNTDCPCILVKRPVHPVKCQDCNKPSPCTCKIQVPTKPYPVYDHLGDIMGHQCPKCMKPIPCKCPHNNFIGTPDSSTCMISHNELNPAKLCPICRYIKEQDFVTLNTKNRTGVWVKPILSNRNGCTLQHTDENPSYKCIACFPSIQGGITGDDFEKGIPHVFTKARNILECEVGMPQFMAKFDLDPQKHATLVSSGVGLGVLLLAIGSLLSCKNSTPGKTMTFMAAIIALSATIRAKTTIAAEMKEVFTTIMSFVYGVFGKEYRTHKQQVIIDRGQKILEAHYRVDRLIADLRIDFFGLMRTDAMSRLLQEKKNVNEIWESLRLYHGELYDYRVHVDAINDAYKMILTMQTDLFNSRLGRQMPVRIYLYGPPGIGKTHFQDALRDKLNEHYGCSHFTRNINDEYFSGMPPSVGVLCYDDMGAQISRGKTSDLAEWRMYAHEGDARTVGAAIEEKGRPLAPMFMIASSNFRVIDEQMDTDLRVVDAFNRRRDIVIGFHNPRVVEMRREGILFDEQDDDFWQLNPTDQWIARNAGPEEKAYYLHHERPIHVELQEVFEWCVNMEKRNRNKFIDKVAKLKHLLPEGMLIPEKVEYDIPMLDPRFASNRVRLNPQDFMAPITTDHHKDFCEAKYEINHMRMPKGMITDEEKASLIRAINNRLDSKMYEKYCKQNCYAAFFLLGNSCCRCQHETVSFVEEVQTYMSESTGISHNLAKLFEFIWNQSESGQALTYGIEQHTVFKQYPILIEGDSHLGKTYTINRLGRVDRWFEGIITSNKVMYMDDVTINQNNLDLAKDYAYRFHQGQDNALMWVFTANDDVALAKTQDYSVLRNRCVVVSMKFARKTRKILGPNIMYTRQDIEDLDEKNDQTIGRMIDVTVKYPNSPITKVPYSHVTAVLNNYIDNPLREEETIETEQVPTVPPVNEDVLLDFSDFDVAQTLEAINISPLNLLAINKLKSRITVFHELPIGVLECLSMIQKVSSIIKKCKSLDRIEDIARYVNRQKIKTPYIQCIVRIRVNSGDLIILLDDTPGEVNVQCVMDEESLGRVNEAGHFTENGVEQLPEDGNDAIVRLFAKFNDRFGNEVKREPQEVMAAIEERATVEGVKGSALLRSGLALVQIIIQFGLVAHNISYGMERMTLHRNAGAIAGAYPNQMDFLQNQRVMTGKASRAMTSPSGCWYIWNEELLVKFDTIGEFLNWSKDHPRKFELFKLFLHQNPQFAVPFFLTPDDTDLDPTWQTLLGMKQDIYDVPPGAIFSSYEDMKQYMRRAVGFMECPNPKTVPVSFLQVEVDIIFPFVIGKNAHFESFVWTGSEKVLLSKEASLTSNLEGDSPPMDEQKRKKVQRRVERKRVPEVEEVSLALTSEGESPPTDEKKSKKIQRRIQRKRIPEVEEEGESPPNDENKQKKTQRRILKRRQRTGLEADASDVPAMTNALAGKTFSLTGGSYKVVIEADDRKFMNELEKAKINLGNRGIAYSYAFKSKLGHYSYEGKSFPLKHYLHELTTKFQASVLISYPKSVEPLAIYTDLQSRVPQEETLLDGSIVAVDRKFYRHYGIVLGGSVYQLKSTDGEASTSVQTLPLTDDWKEANIDGKSIQMGSEYKILTPLSHEEIEANIKKSLGVKVPYSIGQFNCEHYAHLMRYGVGFSHQSSFVTKYNIVKFLANMGFMKNFNPVYTMENQACSDVTASTLVTKTLPDRHIFGLMNSTGTGFYCSALAWGGRNLITVSHVPGMAIGAKFNVARYCWRKLKWEVYTTKVERINKSKDLAHLVITDDVFELIPSIKNHFILSSDLHDFLYKPVSSKILITRRNPLERPTTNTIISMETYADATDLTTPSSLEITHSVFVGSSGSADNMTQKGDCGAPYVRFSQTRDRKIYGIHRAGSNSFASCAIVTQEDLTDFEMNYTLEVETTEKASEELPLLVHNNDGWQPFYNKSSVHMTEWDEILAERTEGIPGEVWGTSDYSPYLPTKTKIKRTGLVAPEGDTMEPAILSNKDRRNPGHKCVNQGIGLYDYERAPIDAKEIDDAYRSIFDWYLTLFRSKGYTLRTLTREESINSPHSLEYPASNPLNRDASPGFPYQKAHGVVKNRDYFWEDKDQKMWRVVDQPHGKKLHEAIDSLKVSYKKGYRRGVIFSCYPKDELVKESKIYGETQKTRVFMSAPLPYTILHRQYFLAFFSRMQECFGDHPVKIGINPTSLEWNQLYMYHAGVGTCGFDTDCKNWDANIHPEFQKQLPKHINRLYRALDPNWKLEDDVIRRGIHSAVEEPFVVNGNKIIRLPGGQVSGQPGTAPENSLINIALNYIVWKRLAIKNGKSELANYNSFVGNVALSVYGDDAMCTVNAEHLAWYNFNAFVAEAVTLQFDVTAALKDGNSSPFKHLEEMSFLKRSFRWEGAYVVGPIAISSVAKGLCWHKGTGSIDLVNLPFKMQDGKVCLEYPLCDTNDFEEVLTGCFRELALHGKETYDRWMISIQRQLRPYQYTFSHCFYSAWDEMQIPYSDDPDYSGSPANQDPAFNACPSYID